MRNATSMRLSHGWKSDDEQNDQNDGVMYRRYDSIEDGNKIRWVQILIAALKRGLELDLSQPVSSADARHAAASKEAVL